jgi:hypothetical protein
MAREQFLNFGSSTYLQQPDQIEDKKRSTRNIGAPSIVPQIAFTEVSKL